VFVFSIVSGGGPRVPDPDMSMSRPASTGQVSTGRVGSVVGTVAGSPLGCDARCPAGQYTCSAYSHSKDLRLLASFSLMPAGRNIESQRPLPPSTRMTSTKAVAPGRST